MFYLKHMFLLFGNENLTKKFIISKNSRKYSPLSIFLGTKTIGKINQKNTKRKSMKIRFSPFRKFSFNVTSNKKFFSFRFNRIERKFSVFSFPYDFMWLLWFSISIFTQLYIEKQNIMQYNEPVLTLQK